MSEIKVNPEIYFHVTGKSEYHSYPQVSPLQLCYFYSIPKYFHSFAGFFFLKFYIVVGLFPFCLSLHNNFAIVH